jgi:hypothetical protein
VHEAAVCDSCAWGYACDLLPIGRACALNQYALPLSTGCLQVAPDKTSRGVAVVCRSWDDSVNFGTALSIVAGLGIATNESLTTSLTQALIDAYDLVRRGLHQACGMLPVAVLVTAPAPTGCALQHHRVAPHPTAPCADAAAAPTACSVKSHPAQAASMEALIHHPL